MTASFASRCLVKNTVSLAWRLGRAVALATKQSNLSNVGSVIVEALGGKETARVLFSGKIVEVGRRTFKGHVIGEVVIQAMKAGEEEEEEGKETFEGTLRSESSAHRSLLQPLTPSLLMPVPFKNETLYAEHEVDGVKKVRPSF